MAQRVAEAEAGAEAARRPDDPEIALQTETLPGDGGEDEQTLTVSQRFDLSDRRDLEARASLARRRIAALDGDARRRSVAAQVRTHFYDVLHQQGRHAALAAWAGELRGALELVAQREAAGDASAYDRQRIALELRGATHRLAMAELERDEAWWRLASWCHLDSAGAWPRVAGVLSPNPTAAGTAVTSPELERLQVEAEVARLLGEARAALARPALTVQAGVKSAHAAEERRYGVVAGVALSVPWSGPGDAERQRGAARASAALLRRDLRKAELDGRIGALALEAAALSAAAAKLRKDSRAANDRLMATARAAYAGGELGLLELVDAQRGAGEDALRVLDLERRARAADTEFIALTGAAGP